MKILKEIVYCAFVRACVRACNFPNFGAIYLYTKQNLNVVNTNNKYYLKLIETVSVSIYLKESNYSSKISSQKVLFFIGS